jgi:hypothetical protein
MGSSDSLEAAKLELEPAIPRSRFTVFVFGPTLKPEESVSVPTTPISGHDTTAEHAKYLRFLTKQRLEELGFRVDLGESPDVLDFWHRFFGAPNPGAAEMLHASKMCGAIVIFPATFGSMAELALFALKPTIAQKTMAIVHKDYEHANSFFRRGLLELFDTWNGKVRYLDHADAETCVRYAERFVEGKYTKFCAEADDFREIKSRHRGTVFQNVLENSTD